MGQPQRLWRFILLQNTLNRFLFLKLFTVTALDHGSAVFCDPWMSNDLLDCRALLLIFLQHSFKQLDKQSIISDDTVVGLVI